MNCTEFRFAVGADPQHLSAEAQAHRDSCEQCRAYATQMLELDRKLKRALELPLPQPQPFQIPAEPARIQSRPGTRWYALAASMMLAIAIGVVAWFGGTRDALASDSVKHMQGEIASMVATVERPPETDVDAALARAGVRLRSSMAVSYAQQCGFRGHVVPHLVVQTNRGPVTVLVLKYEHVKHRENFHESGYSGVLAPSGPGTLAVIAQDDATVNEALSEIDHALDWTQEQKWPKT
jgi:hypothetical protein